MDFAIFTLKNGIIKRSSNIVRIKWLFLVKAVGFTIEFIIMSSKPPPICLTINVLIQGNFLSLGNPNKGLVNMHPLTFNSLLYINNFVVTKAPKLCA